LAQGLKVLSRQQGVGMEKNQEFTQRGQGPGVHLAAPAPGRRQQPGKGKASRHRQGIVSTAAINYNNLQVRVPGEAGQGLLQDFLFIENGDNYGDDGSQENHGV
jgi:hypothetical protein